MADRIFTGDSDRNGKQKKKRTRGRWLSKKYMKTFGSNIFLKKSLGISSILQVNHLKKRKEEKENHITVNA